ncbi:hypothetical protein Pelo_14713 [Pelomyxa schiedti]|nr:hypothetical protein Pelo_14713 [Pelomyxa schiedti]
MLGYFVLHIPHNESVRGLPNFTTPPRAIYFTYVKMHSITWVSKNYGSSYNDSLHKVSVLLCHCYKKILHLH